MIMTVCVNWIQLINSLPFYHHPDNCEKVCHGYMELNWIHNATVWNYVHVKQPSQLSVKSSLAKTRFFYPNRKRQSAIKFVSITSSDEWINGLLLLIFPLERADLILEKPTVHVGYKPRPSSFRWDWRPVDGPWVTIRLQFLIGNGGEE